MCGIFGYVGLIDKPLAQYCTNTLSHRGPDGSGVWSTPEVTLGHRRLSILDLSENGAQPMQSHHGRYWITFNGEIYNFLELRVELAKNGHQFRTNSDTEVVLCAFLEWGELCQLKFNGMWAFAIWDTHTSSLFISRDRFGKKPFFYTTLPHRNFAFASEMKALMPLMKSVMADESLVRDVSRIFSYEGTEKCVVDNIFRLKAGHCGWVMGGQISIRRWWCTLDHLLDIPAKYDDQVEFFRELFLDSCKLRMRSDVSLGTALSGGLDSSATITSMAEVAKNSSLDVSNRDWQHAYVASFPGTPLDEVKYAKLVTDSLGIQANIIQIDPLKSINDLDEYLYLFEDLYITSPIPFMQTYAAIKSDGVSVTLDGHGADELFGGYAFDFINGLNAVAPWSVQSKQILDCYYESHGDSEQLNNLKSKNVFMAKWYGKKLIKTLIGHNRNTFGLDQDHPLWCDLDWLNKRLYQSVHETVLPTLLRNYDRYSMANGVEIRMPFMDHRIVSFAFSLPWTSKIRNGYSKSIIRDALGIFMPQEIAYRKTKIGFNSPIVDWMKGPLRPFMLDTIHSKEFRDCNLINPKKVSNKIMQVIKDPGATFNDGTAAWTMLSPFLWERAVIRNRRFKQNISFSEGL
jgi:asparagine synthase (glutamine-hydrolysing)